MNDHAFTTSMRWLLPEGIDELLPPRAAELERLRRELLDLFSSWGYELIMPPFIEFLDSLLTGTGHDLDLQTFKITDQLSGRLMGIRADMTPQAARIDAHQLRREEPSRLCYIGTVLRTRPDSIGGSRDPVQVGAELFGHDGIESDIEIISLMVEVLRTAGITRPYLDIGHVGIFRSLVRQAELAPAVEAALYDALHRKARADIDELLATVDAPTPVRDMLSALSDLHGGIEVLDEIAEVLRPANGEVQQALANLRGIAELIAQRFPDLPLHFDLAELRGYRYHTGAVFAAFTPGYGRELARGGRYDEVGRVFGGAARPATGFSTDLKALASLGKRESRQKPGIFADWSNDPALIAEVERLRRSGERVIWALPGQRGDARAMGCDRRLVRAPDNSWQVVPV
ncbi:MAG: ATP phosphoribosyltransferase regulatory subunit [Xanthomonadaceae bacterium]|nr:ATP phosphoribosyltransferase regulatory subunit [Xanthomonadaceae bacterium]